MLKTYIECATFCSLRSQNLSCISTKRKSFRQCSTEMAICKNKGRFETLFVLCYNSQQRLLAASYVSWCIAFQYVKKVGNICLYTFRKLAPNS